MQISGFSTLTWRRSFAAVGADNQYAPLGLMLEGTLARVVEIIAPLQRVAEKAVPTAAEKQDSVTEDVGEPVMREIQAFDPRPKVVEQPELKPGKTEKRSKRVASASANSVPKNDSSSKPPKKKRKKGNAIDDIFSGII